MSNSHRPRRAHAAVSIAPCAALRCAVLWAPLACAPRGAAARRPAPGSVAPGSVAPGSVAPQAVRDTSSVALAGGKTVERLFTGRFPGVSVTAAANGGLQIRIRGGATSFMAGEEPLYVVDGTPLPAGTGGIVFLNPYDIERIEVLKNPADVGVYGVRGANGVIRITTLKPGRR